MVIHYLHPDCKGNAFIIAKTSCGRDIDYVGDYDSRLKYVTCKKCLKNSYKRNCF
jgi:hypothetical protein